MIDNLDRGELETIEFSPLKNHDAISLVKRKDGNWRGFRVNNGKIVQVRQSDPGVVLQLLLTTDGTMSLEDTSVPAADENEVAEAEAEAAEDAVADEAENTATDEAEEAPAEEAADEAEKSEGEGEKSEDA